MSEFTVDDEGEAELIVRALRAYADAIAYEHAEYGNANAADFANMEDAKALADDFATAFGIKGE